MTLALLAAWRQSDRATGFFPTSVQTMCIIRFLDSLLATAACALLSLSLNHLLKLVACATDGEPLVVEQLPDPANHQHLVVLVITAIASALHRSKLGELLLPIAKHMRLYPAQIPHLTDGEIAFRGDGGRSFSMQIKSVRDEPSNLL